MSGWNQFHNSVAGSSVSGGSITVTDRLSRNLGDEPNENIDNHIVQKLLIRSTCSIAGCNGGNMLTVAQDRNSLKH